MIIFWLKPSETPQSACCYRTGSKTMLFRFLLRLLTSQLQHAKSIFSCNGKTLNHEKVEPFAGSDFLLSNSALCGTGGDWRKSVVFFCLCLHKLPNYCVTFFSMTTGIENRSNWERCHSLTQSLLRFPAARKITSSCFKICVNDIIFYYSVFKELSCTLKVYSGRLKGVMGRAILPPVVVVQQGNILYTI